MRWATGSTSRSRRSRKRHIDDDVAARTSKPFTHFSQRGRGPPSSPALRDRATARTRRSRTPALDGGCRVKPFRKSWCVLEEVHARAAVRDNVVTDGPLPTDGMPVFGAHP
jgi:hypothetical protein